MIAVDTPVRSGHAEEVPLLGRSKPRVGYCAQLWSCNRRPTLFVLANADLAFKVANFCALLYLLKVCQTVALTQRLIMQAKSDLRDLQVGCLRLP